MGDQTAIAEKERVTMTAKDLLLKELHDAFSGDDEMSLKASLGNLTQAEASRRLNETTWTIEEILYHIASCEVEYCRQGFGKAIEYDKPMGDIDEMLALVDKAHELLMQCLDDCSAEDLESPIKTRYHGESAAHFFWIMIMHRVSHAAQIRSIRRAYGSRTHFYPV